MGLLRSYWLIALLALFLNLGISMVLLVRALDSIAAAQAPLDEPNEGTSRFFDFYTREVDDLAEELKKREERLAHEEKKMRDWERRLDLEEVELERVRKELKMVREEFSQTIIQVKANEMKNVKELAQTYAAMSPESVVTIFGELDDTFVVKLLKNMPKDAVGPIFQLMALNAQEPEQVKRVAKFAQMLRLTLPPEDAKRAGQ